MSTSSSGIITPGTRSPIERHPILDTSRGAVAAAARALPMTGIPQAQPTSAWTTAHSAYSAPPASTIEPRSAHPDVSPAQTAVRWDTQAHSVPAQMPVAESSIHTSPTGGLPHPTGYNYHVQSYGQSMPYQNEGQHLDYRPAPTPTATSPSYSQQQHLAGSLQQSTGYPQYQSQPGYLPNTAHSPEGQPMMYTQR